MQDLVSEMNRFQALVKEALERADGDVTEISALKEAVLVAGGKQESRHAYTDGTDNTTSQPLPRAPRSARPNRTLSGWVPFVPHKNARRRTTRLQAHRSARLLLAQRSKVSFPIHKEMYLGTFWLTKTLSQSKMARLQPHVSSFSRHRSTWMACPSPRHRPLQAALHPNCSPRVS